MEACKDVDVAVMVGGFPRKGGMERKDVMAKNVAIYKSQAAALEKGAKPDVKVTIITHLSSTVMLQSYVQHACTHSFHCSFTWRMSVCFQGRYQQSWIAPCVYSYAS